MTPRSEKIGSQKKPLPPRALGHPEATGAGSGASGKEREDQGTGLRAFLLGT